MSQILKNFNVHLKSVKSVKSREAVVPPVEKSFSGLSWLGLLTPQACKGFALLLQVSVNKCLFEEVIVKMQVDTPHETILSPNFVKNPCSIWGIFIWISRSTPF